MPPLSKDRGATSTGLAGAAVATVARDAITPRATMCMLWGEKKMGDEIGVESFLYWGLVVHSPLRNVLVL